MSLKYLFQLILLSALWGSSYFFVEVALTEITPMVQVFIRLGVATLILSIIVWINKIPIPTDYKTWRIYVLIALIHNVIPFSLITWSQFHITGSIASILNATVAIFTIIVAHFMTQDEKFCLRKSFGVLIGFFGVVVIMWPSMTQGFSIQNVGQLAALFASFLYAIAITVGKRLSAHSPVANSFAVMGLATFIMIPLCFIFEDPLGLNYTVTAFSAAAAQGLLGSALAFLLYFKLLKEGGATNVSFAGFLIPVCAIILNAAFLGENIGWYGFAGMAIIFAALALINEKIAQLFQKK